MARMKIEDINDPITEIGEQRRQDEQISLQRRQIVALERIAGALDRLADCVVDSNSGPYLRVWDAFQEWRMNL
jgi:hypothetical protein